MSSAHNCLLSYKMRLSKEPERILERKMVKGRATTKVLIKLSNEDEADATWEFIYDLLQKYPSFQP